MPDRFGNLMTIDLRRTTGEPVEPDDMPIIKAMVDEIPRGGRSSSGGESTIG